MLVKEYYQYSDSKTEEIVDLISDDQLKEIKNFETRREKVNEEDDIFNGLGIEVS